MEQASPEATTRSDKATLLELGDRLLIGDEPKTSPVFRVESVTPRQVKSGGGDVEWVICLDREWVEDLQSGSMELDVHRLPSPLFSHADRLGIKPSLSLDKPSCTALYVNEWCPLNFGRLLYRLHKSLPYQGGVYLSILAIRPAAKNFRDMAALCVRDDGDDQVALLVRSRVKLLALSAFCLNLERRLMRQRYRFIHAKKRTKMRHTAGAVIARLRMECYKAVAKGQESLQKLRKLALERKDIYAMWEGSHDQVTVVVAYMVEGEQPPDRLGQIKIDTDAPCMVLREKIRRAMPGQLNQRNGEGFGFLVRLACYYPLYLWQKRLLREHLRLKL